MPLKFINQMQSFQQSSSGFESTLTAKLRMPGNPVLAVFCCAPQKVSLREKRTGTVMAHGNKQWLPCIPTFHLPDSSSGSTYTWNFPRCQCGAGRQAKWAITELGAPPILQWSSLLHSADTCNAEVITAEPVQNIVSIPGPPGFPMDGPLVRGTNIEWAVNGGFLRSAGYMKISFTGVSTSNSAIAGGTGKLHIQEVPGSIVASSDEINYPPNPDLVSAEVSFTTPLSAPALALYQVLWEVISGMPGSCQGAVTLTYLP